MNKDRKSKNKNEEDEEARGAKKKSAKHKDPCNPIKPTLGNFLIQ